MPANPIQPRCLKIEDAAGYLAIGRSEIYRLMEKDAAFPRPFAYDPSGRPKFDIRDLDA